MKMAYEPPMLEVFSFDIQDSVMDSGGDCTAYTGAVCPYDGVCVVDGTCVTDISIPNISAV